MQCSTKSTLISCSRVRFFRSLNRLRRRRRLKRSKIRVILGDHDQYVNTDGNPIMRAVSVVIRHRNFDMNSYNHDVALLKLRKSVKFSKKIRPICLPQLGNTSNNYIDNQWSNISFVTELLKIVFYCFTYVDAGTDPAGKEGTVVGWGRTTEGGMIPGEVHEVQVPIYSLTQCRKMKYRANRITDNMICAGRGNQDSCQGDSGGPLLIQETDKYEIAGIKSLDSFTYIISLYLVRKINFHFDTYQN